MITFAQRGDFSKTEKFLKANDDLSFRKVIEGYAKQGVAALSAATPVRTGLTANSWSYEIEEHEDSISIIWKNSNVKNGVNIAVILQYGHATANGRYIEGRDYINPALQSIIDSLVDAAWKEVTDK